MRRYASQHRDAAEPEIVAVLRGVGATVSLLDGEEGLPDLLVGFAGVNYLLEVKSPAGLVHYKASLSAGQAVWAAKWAGMAPRTVYTPIEALRAVGVAAGSHTLDALDRSRMVVLNAAIGRPCEGCGGSLRDGDTLRHCTRTSACSRERRRERQQRLTKTRRHDDGEDTGPVPGDSTGT